MEVKGQRMKHERPKKNLFQRVGWLWGIAAFLLMQTPAVAAPPGVSGIHLQTVLSLRDHVRTELVNKSESKSLTRVKTIMIDPGHGGENQGALGCAHIHEKFLTMELAYMLRDQIEAKYPDTKVILTRYWDKSMKLSERMHRANLAGADLFLSLHFNAATHGRAAGVETYFLTTAQALSKTPTKASKRLASTQGGAIGMVKEGPTGPAQGVHQEKVFKKRRDRARRQQHKQSGLLAKSIQSRLVAYTGAADRGVKQANFGVLRGALMPAVVVEAGFLTHPKEGKEVVKEEYHQQVVQALLESVEAFDAQVADQNEL